MVINNNQGKQENLYLSFIKFKPHLYGIFNPFSLPCILPCRPPPTISTYLPFSSRFQKRPSLLRILLLIAGNAVNGREPCICATSCLSLSSLSFLLAWANGLAAKLRTQLGLLTLSGWAMLQAAQAPPTSSRDLSSRLVDRVRNMMCQPCCRRSHDGLTERWGRKRPVK